MPKANIKIVKVRMFIMPFDCRCFNKDQKVFIQEMQGHMSAKVSGRFRSNGSYVSGWVSWDSGRETPSIGIITVESIFARICGLELVEGQQNEIKMD